MAAVLILIYLAILVAIGYLVGKFAENRGHSFGSWFVLGLFFGFISMLACFIGCVAEKKNHSFTKWAALGFFFNLGALVSLQTGLMAKRKNLDFESWALLGMFFGLIATFVVCFAQEVSVKKRVEEFNGQAKVEASKTVVHRTWVCPKCGETNRENALNCVNCFTSKP